MSKLLTNIMGILVILSLSAYGFGGSGVQEEIRPAEKYVIGPEDVLEILVWKNADLSKVVTVRPDGYISLPLIGDVQAAGLSPSALRDEIVKGLSRFKEVPEVSVIVQQVNSYSIYILGEVARPGKYQLKSHVTLLQAISLAGGFTPFASRNDIKVLRKEYGDTQERAFKIHYKDIVSKGDTTQNILLRPGDTIIVPNEMDILGLKAEDMLNQSKTEGGNKASLPE